MRFLVLFLVLSTVVEAQVAPTVVDPVVSEESKILLQNFELRAENISLKIANLQAEFAKLQSEANAYAIKIKKDGYELKRGENGVWIYQPITKEVQPPSEK